MGTVIVVLAAVVAYLAWAYTHPFRPCPRCSGRGTNKLSTRRRSGHCKRCSGSRQVQAIGSRVLHRAVKSVSSSWRGK